MDNKIAGFLDQYGQLNSSALDHIASTAVPMTISKGEFLIKEGQTCTHFNIVTKGCFRLFYLKNGFETSVWFSFADSSAIELHSYLNQSPSEYFLECIDDGEVVRIPKAQVDQLCLEYPDIDQIFRLYWQDVVQKMIGRMTSLQKYSAEERYIQLMHDTDYLHKIPQKYLASYIGVTPTSLSRIRRNVRSKLS